MRYEYLFGRFILQILLLVFMLGALSLPAYAELAVAPEIPQTLWPIPKEPGKVETTRVYIPVVFQQGVVRTYGTASATANALAVSEPVPGEPPKAVGFGLYIPVIFNQSAGCQLNQQEQELAALLLNDPGQQRDALTCKPMLAQVARERAADMANRNYFSHTNPDGYGPNYLVQIAGYPLPAYYSQTKQANNVESIGAGQVTASDVWAALRGSDGHRAHLLGEVPFYREQTEFGIGYVQHPGGTYQRYWVIIIAKPGEQD
jgi:uncharacterized protein YkwD